MRKLFILLFCCLSSWLQAQQEAQYTQFMYNKQLLNPAWVGSRRIPSITVLYRNQWIGFNGNPQSYHLGIDGPFFSERLGAGLVIGNQSDGLTRRLYADLALSYDIVHSEKMTLRVGLSGAMRSYRFDLGSPNVYVRDRIDPSLVTMEHEQLVSNIGTGIYVDYQDFYLGVSIPNLFRNFINIHDNPSVSSPAQEQRHIYAMAGGLFAIMGDALELKPSVLFKYVQNAPFSFDANLSVMFKRTFSVGLSYRYGQSSGAGDSADLLAFFQATNRLGLGIAYDFTLSELKNYSNGSIEALIRYDLGSSNNSAKDGKQRDWKRMSNPRYFF